MVAHVRLGAHLFDPFYFLFVFGWKIYLYVLAGAITILGIGSFINLYSGASLSIPIKLNVKAKAFTNTKFGTAVVYPTKTGLTGFCSFFPNFFIGGYAGWLALIASGLLGVVIRKIVLNHIAKIYRKRKYKTIEAFSKNKPMISIENFTKTYEKKGGLAYRSTEHQKSRKVWSGRQ